VDVPHDWSVSLPFNQSSKASSGGGYLDGGLGWYRKSFTLPASSSGQRLSLLFDGVYMDSTVWVNGSEVCARPYGYSSFECNFTASAKVGASNVVAVKVNNQLPSSRWYSGSGIYRHVWLKTVSPVHVAYTGTRVTTPQVCVAAHSTVRALYASYADNLYQVRRASDKTTKDVRVLMTAAVPSDATDDAIQANIVAAGYGR
jgi:beta-galactosidase/beta-glucuronidase